MPLSCGTRLLLLVLLNQFINSVQGELQGNDIEEVEQIFDEIEEYHNKLKKVFKDLVSQDEPQTQCKCVPFYLCKADGGTIIKDGEGLIITRTYIEEDPCQNIQDVCCMESNNTIELGPRTNLEPTKNCGYGSKAFSNKKQQFAEFGEFPWTVMVAKVREGRGVYACAGSLIHPHVVLTAAHCVNESETIIVRAGEWDKQETGKAKARQNRLINTVIKHPKFKSASLEYDAALLITEEPFILDEDINTACLSSSLPDLIFDPMSNECVATGWGIDKPGGSYSVAMRTMGFFLISSEECQHCLRKTHVGELFQLHQTFVCGFNKYVSDTCQGNGGGPLVCPIPDQPGRLRQVGITSWNVDCASDKPSVFASVPEIKDWVDESFDQFGFSKAYYTYKVKEGMKQ